MNIKKITIILMLFLFGLTAVNALTDNNVDAYYTLDSVITDSTTNNYDLTNNGATTIAGVINNGYNWDGTNDYMTIPNAPINSYDSDSDFSFNLWMNFDVTTSRNDIFSNTGGTGSAYYPLGMITGLSSGSMRVFSQKKCSW